MRVAAIIRRYADMLPRRAMLVVASRRLGIREHRGQDPMWVSFALWVTLRSRTLTFWHSARGAMSDFYARERSYGLYFGWAFRRSGAILRRAERLLRRRLNASVSSAGRCLRVVGR